ncbi:hypothetical protein F4802DRAFT_599763 [Xylaria palmicola]|nr:hypothetical protein F4802DRAFT_599763 [Xylaria palmicola]
MHFSLKEKQAFFEQLDACGNCDEESDALGPEEQSWRHKCKAAADVAVAAVTASVAAPRIPAGQALLGTRPRRTASDPISKPANDELEIIAVTPRGNRPATTVSASALGAPMSDSIIPATEKRLDQRPTRVLRSQSNLEPSPSVSMAKRKRSKPLQMAPESQQIFRGLSFFYVPNDDVNPARRLRINKAQEHGATWTKSTAEATHVIVDKGLSYDDIRPVLDHNLTSSSIVLVNDGYPIECLRRGAIFDPNQTVERLRYEVLGDPKLTEEKTAPQQPIEEPTASPPLKPRRSSRRATKSTPESTQRSVDFIPSSHPEEIQLQQPAAEPSITVALPTGPTPCGADRTATPAFTDELAACIDAVLDDPENHEYLDESDPEAQGSEGEGPLKKKKTKKGKGRPNRARNGAGTSFNQDKFVCMRGGTKDKKLSGPNADTIRLLEEMIEEHHLSDEIWRVHSYRKAVSTLRRQPRRITTAKEAAALPNIGSSLAEHIEEIATTGRFGKLEQIRGEPSRAALKVFCNVYGVGVPTARRWVELGHRTLDDLRTKARLSPNQRLGVERYDDLLTRIPRAEVEALGDHVKRAAAALDPGVELIVGGSYRRGADTSGDVDFLITKSGTTTTRELVPFLDRLVAALTREGFLTAALASHQHGRDKGGGGNKWHGCCVLPANAAFPGPAAAAAAATYRPTWRRVDFLLAPAAELGAALVYFTGNDLFNRSLRLLARRRGMRLNQRALSGAGVHEGRDERKIFEILGVQWREPHERWC